MQVRVLDAKTVEIQFDIQPQYYLYKDRFKFSIEPGAIQLGTPALPKGQMKDDPQFGWVETYHDTLRYTLPIEPGEARQFVLTVSSQGCWEGGVCYPPLEQSATLSLDANGSTPLLNTADSAPFTKDSILPSRSTPGSFAEKASNASPLTSSSTVESASAPATTDEGQHFANLIKNQSAFYVVLAFFGLGVLLAFTPCVLPMLPILSSLIIGQGHAISKRRAFLLSSVYVLAMASTYALAGVAAGASGTLLSAQLQNVWVLGAFALIFVVLAGAMLGFYELQLPSALQTRLSTQANQQGQGQIWGVASMGVLSALLVGPCVTAPLVGGLLYISQTGDALLGGVALFALGLGMGMPLVIIGTAARNFLPKPGAWMEAVKRFFGFMLLATAIWMLSPVLPGAVTLLLWGALAVVCAVFLSAFDRLPEAASPGKKVFKGLGILLGIYGIALVLGGLAGASNPLQPLAGLRAQTNAVSTPAFPPFERIQNLEQLDAKLAQATQPVMLDFYADWCVSCKEMEHLTFTDPGVAEQMQKFVRLQVDVTANTAADQALLKRFGLYGPPGIIFFRPGGEELRSPRVVGYQKADVFLQSLNQASRCAGETRC